MSVARCRREVSHREFIDWLAVNRIEPIGPERQDAMLQMVCHVIASVNGAKHSKPSDYAIAWETREQVDERASKITVAQVVGAIMAM